MEKENFELIKFTTPEGMGLDDRFMVDAEHPGEVFCALQLKRYVLLYPTKSEVLKSLSFSTLDSLLADKHSLPISFLKDSINYSLKANMDSIKAINQ